MKGYLFLNQELQENIRINYHDDKVTPEKPFYEINEEEKIVNLYVNKCRSKDYKNEIQKELKNKIQNLELYQIQYITVLKELI